jgi:hypothetical protein
MAKSKSPLSKLGSKHSVGKVVLFVGAALLIVYLVRSYGKGKNNNKETMSGAGSKRAQARRQFYDTAMGESSQSVKPAPQGGSSFAKVNGNGNQSNPNGQGLPPSCSAQPAMNPSELLPKDDNSQWSQLNPGGAGALQDVNLLSAGALIGIDTVGNTLRNANLQERSEPANPQLNVGPWNNTTIAPDTMRVPLEIGQGGQ